jgi:hypothetical protein
MKTWFMNILWLEWNLFHLIAILNEFFAENYAKFWIEKFLEIRRHPPSVIFNTEGMMG